MNNLLLFSSEHDPLKDKDKKKKQKKHMVIEQIFPNHYVPTMSVMFYFSEKSRVCMLVLCHVRITY